LDTTGIKEFYSDKYKEESCHSYRTSLVNFFLEKIMDIELKLTVEEVNYVIGVLGELPSKSGAWPLIIKIKEQGENQVAKPEPPSTDSNKH
jgi:hypothetical protein